MRAIRTTATTAILAGALVASLGYASAQATVGVPRGLMEGEQAPGQYDLAKSDPVRDPIYPSYGFTETDALHYHLGLAWDGNTLDGTATITVRAAHATDSLRFNLSSALAVSSVTLDGTQVDYTHDRDLLTVSTGSLAQDSTHKVVVTYAGRPRPVKMPSPRGNTLGWNVSRDGSVSTMQEPYGAFTWYPVNDHPSDKAFYDATITTKSGVMGVFNGVLKDSSTTNGKTTTTWHLDKPAASYLTTIAIDPFEVDEQVMSDGKTFYLWHTAEDKRKLNEWRRESKQAYEWLIKHAGENPFASMGMVIVDAPSAMETQTMMTMGRGAMQHGYGSLIVHEMGHQWFGDMVTTKTWKDTWLNEGWTMYFQHAYQKAVNVEASARTCRRDVQRSGQAGNPNADSFAMMNVYECPVPAIDHVRRDIGDDRFFEIASKWPAQHAYSSEDRQEFESWLKQETGNDYSGIFAKWLDQVSARGELTPREAHLKHLAIELGAGE